MALLTKTQRRRQNIQRQAQQNANVSATIPKDVRCMFDLSPYDACYIVGGGPSLKGFNWKCLNGKFVIAINRSYEVLPNAQILYFTDLDYWKTHKVAMKKHRGKIMRGTLKLGDTRDPDVHEWHLSGERGIDDTPGKLRHGRNSTYAAINIAGVHLGFKKIYLLGIDMKWGKPKDKKTSHWHNGHRRVDGEATYKSMVKNFNGLAPLLKTRNVEVININTDTELKAFPIKTYQEVFGDICIKKSANK